MLAELLGQEQEGDGDLAAQAVAAPMGEEEAGEGNKEMSVEEEKDALKRRLAELEEGERQGLESRYFVKGKLYCCNSCAGSVPRSLRLRE